MESARVLGTKTSSSAESSKSLPVVAARSATPAARPATLIQTAGPVIGLSSHGAAVAPASGSASFSQAGAVSLGGGHEQQADGAADVALRMPVFSSPDAGGSPRSHATIAATPSSGYPGLGGGRQLSAPIRNQFEHTYGWDFSRVRLHTGSSAVAAANREGAKAFTSGHDIAFGSQVSDPEAGTHRHLLAHELAHVVQQNKSAGPPVTPPASNRVAAAKPLAASLSAVPSGRVQRRPSVTAVNLPAVAELGVSGGSITAIATAPAGAALTWTLLGAPGGVTHVADGTPLGRRIKAAAAPAGSRFRIRCALTANPHDKADSGFITLVGITDIRFVPSPPFIPIAALGPASGPTNTADANRDGLAGNKANVIVRTNPGGSPTTRPVTVTLPTALGATAAARVITTGPTTGDVVVQVADDATGTSQRATLIVNPVPTSLNAFPSQAPSASGSQYGCRNTFGWAWSDATARGRNRIVGEIIAATPPSHDDFGFPPPNNGWNPAPVLTLAVPANSWRDQLYTPIGPKTGATGDGNVINVNRHVGPGVAAAAALPKFLAYSQGFAYSSWTGAWSSRFELGFNRRTLMQVGTNFIMRTEHVFPGAAAPAFDERYKGPPLITLSNIRVAPLAPAARALAADSTATASVRVNTTVPHRQVRWNAVSGAPVTFLIPAAPATPVAVNAVAQVRAGAAAGAFTIRASDSIFPQRQFDGTGNVVAVALNILSPQLQSIAAGVRTAIIDLMADPGGRTINWTLGAGAIAGGVTLTRSSPSGGAAPNRRATITRPASFIGPVTVTAVDSILPARTQTFTINFL